MTKSVGRVLLTVLMYTGVLVFFVPYLLEKSGSAWRFQAGGAVVAVACGLLRCYLTEGDCF
jgi:hypothetical protein